MRHPFRYLPFPKPKQSFTVPRKAHQLGFKGFSFNKEASGQQTWAIAARRHRRKARGEGRQGRRGKPQTRYSNFYNQ